MSALIPPSNVAQSIGSGRIGLYQHGNGVAALSDPARSALYATWAATGVEPDGSGASVAEIGCPAPGVPANAPHLGFGGHFAADRSTVLPDARPTWRRMPVEVNMNCIGGAGVGNGSYTAPIGSAHPGRVYPFYFSAANLALVEASIADAATYGAKNFAVFQTPNNGGEDLDDPYATSGYWANVRAAAAFGGGIALDVPTNYYLANRGVQYQAFVKQMIVYEVAQGHRVSLVLSPYINGKDAAGNTSGAAFDPAFVENCLAVLADLKSAGAMPTQVVIENYSTVGDPNQPATDGTPESANAAALAVARLVALAPSGMVPATGNGIAEAGLMAGPSHTFVTADLANHRGPLTLADVPGVGSMAWQDSTNVNVKDGVAAFRSLVLNGPATFNQDVGVFGGLTVQGVATRTLTSAFPVTGFSLAWNLSGANNESDLLVSPGGLDIRQKDPATGVPLRRLLTLDGPSGMLTLPGAMVMGGSLATPSLGVTGNGAVHGTLTVGAVVSTLPNADPHVAGQFYQNGAHQVMVSGG